MLFSSIPRSSDPTSASRDSFTLPYRCTTALLYPKDYPWDNLVNALETRPWLAYKWCLFHPKSWLQLKQYTFQVELVVGYQPLWIPPYILYWWDIQYRSYTISYTLTSRFKLTLVAVHTYLLSAWSMWSIRTSLAGKQLRPRRFVRWKFRLLLWWASDLEQVDSGSIRRCGLRGCRLLDLCRSRVVVRLELWIRRQELLLASLGSQSWWLTPGAVLREEWGASLL